MFSSSSGESLLNSDLINGNSLFSSQEKPSDAADVLMSFSDVVLIFPGLYYFSKIWYVGSLRCSCVCLYWKLMLANRRDENRARRRLLYMAPSICLCEPINFAFGYTWYFYHILSPILSWNMLDFEKYGVKYCVKLNVLA